MEKNLINSLLRIYHSDKMRHASNKALSQFAKDYNIGNVIRGSIAFSCTEKEEIRQLLMASEGIDAGTTYPDQWAGLSRTASLHYGSNEKLTTAVVRADRVAVKTLPNGVLLFDGQSFALPSGANLDIAWEQLTLSNRHKSVLVVENWEAFDSIHTLAFEVDLIDPNPLVLFRGSPIYRQDHVMSLLHALSLPVYAFVDFDPSGLVIAQSLPFFAGILAPTSERLSQALLEANNCDRYMQQLPETQDKLNNASHPDIIAIWKLLQVHGKALPQEYFL